MNGGLRLVYDDDDRFLRADPDFLSGQKWRIFIIFSGTLPQKAFAETKTFLTTPSQ